MKKRIHFALPLVLVAVLFTKCADHKPASSETIEVVEKDKADRKPSVNANLESEVPDFSAPAAKQYYGGFIAYLKKVVTTIRNKDEAGVMKLFREEGSQWDNDRDKMEALAKSTPADEQKFNTWYLQSVVPLLHEVVRSDYYRKYNEEYNKKAREDFKKKEY